MAYLTGLEIERQIGLGHIQIEPYNRSQLNPNSYNLRLHPQLKVYAATKHLDSHADNKTINITIPDSGIILQPNILYLGRTVERTFTDKFVPTIDGRSSTGRLGIFPHTCAGFGDVGFNGTWTLEIYVIQPVIVYPYEEICQICFNTVEGEIGSLYNGRYQGQIDTTPSRMYMTKEEVQNAKAENN